MKNQTGFRSYSEELAAIVAERRAKSLAPAAVSEAAVPVGSSKRASRKQNEELIAAVKNEGRALSAAIAALGAIAWKNHKDTKKTLESIDRKLSKLERDVNNRSGESKKSAEVVSDRVSEIQRSVKTLVTTSQLEKELEKALQNVIDATRDENKKRQNERFHASLSGKKTGSSPAPRRPKREDVRELAGDVDATSRLIVG